MLSSWVTTICHCSEAIWLITYCHTVQVVVDLPQTRRNVSPQKPAVSAAQSSDPNTAPPAELAGDAVPAEHAVPADEPAMSPDHSMSVPSQTQRPFSSKPDGPIGWIEPDEATTLNDSELITAAATAAAAESGAFTSLQQASDSTLTDLSTGSQAAQPSTHSSIDRPILSSSSMQHAGSNPGVASQPECDTSGQSCGLAPEHISPAETAHPSAGIAQYVRLVASGHPMICCHNLTYRATPNAVTK